MMGMRLLSLITLLVLLAACSAGGAGGPTATGLPANNESAQAPVASATPTPGQSAATRLAPTTTRQTSLPASHPTVSLGLNILSPQNNAVVNQPQINLTGSIDRQAVLSVNSDIYILSPGNFSLPVTLEEGPNALEIAASDYDGNETDLVLVVTYQP
jgi:hypothetical protein